MDVGGVIMAFVLVIGFPITFMVTGLMVASVLGQRLCLDGENRYRPVRESPDAPE